MQNHHSIQLYMSSQRSASDHAQFQCTVTVPFCLSILFTSSYKCFGNISVSISRSGCTLPKTHHAMTTHNRTIPGSTRTVPSTIHQDRGVKYAQVWDLPQNPTKWTTRDRVPYTLKHSQATLRQKAHVGPKDLPTALITSRRWTWHSPNGQHHNQIY